MKKLDKGNYVPGEGPSGARIAIVGEAPGFDEEKERKPFIGKAGRKLDQLLSEAGLDRSEIYVTNVVKYRPPDNNFKFLDQIGVNLQEQINNLFVELRALNPNIVIALGEEALKALTDRSKITKYRGSLLKATYGDFKVLPTIHPAALLYSENPYYRKDGESKGAVA